MVYRSPDRTKYVSIRGRTRCRVTRTENLYPGSLHYTSCYSCHGAKTAPVRTKPTLSRALDLPTDPAPRDDSDPPGTALVTRPGSGACTAEGRDRRKRSGYLWHNLEEGRNPEPTARGGAHGGSTAKPGLFTACRYDSLGLCPARFKSSCSA